MNDRLKKNCKIRINLEREIPEFKKKIVQLIFDKLHRHFTPRLPPSVSPESYKFNHVFMTMPLRHFPFSPPPSVRHPFPRSPPFSFLSFGHSSTTLSVNPKPKFNAVHADESSNLCTDRRAGVVLHAAACTCTLWRLYGEQTQREAARPDRARAWSRDNPVMDVPR